ATTILTIVHENRAFPCRAPSLSALATACVLLASGCGRRATEADCQLIVDKSVEVQLRQVSDTDPLSIEKREAQVRAQLSGDLASCVGRHITDKTIACVSEARSPGDLDTCLH
ncbi:MAG: hypothetical protein ACREJ3_12260, partial [Polyangiaceae bacterium]